MVFGLPGEAATVLIAGWMSIGGGVSVAAALIDQGSIGVHDIAILCPALILMGSQLQYMGRCSGVIGTRGSRIPLLMSISVLNAMIAMLIMSIIVYLKSLITTLRHSSNSLCHSGSPEWHFLSHLKILV